MNSVRKLDFATTKFFPMLYKLLSSALLLKAFERDNARRSLTKRLNKRSINTILMITLCNNFSSELNALLICILRYCFLSYYISELMICLKTHKLLILPERDRDPCVNRLTDRYSFCLTETCFL